MKPTFALFLGSGFQLIGAIGFALSPFSISIQSYQYTFQVLFGFGSGISNSIATTSILLVVAAKDICQYSFNSRFYCFEVKNATAAAFGANTQFFCLGGAVGL